MGKAKKSLGIVGIGLMGSALAERALAAGFHVVGYDVSSERLAAFEKLGGQSAESAKQVASKCRTIVFSVLTSEQVVETVSQMSRDLHPGDLVVDTTTGSPDEMVALGKRLKRRSIDYLDACIAGNSDEARAGNVMVLAGGDPAALKRTRPFLDCFARRVFHLGPVGAGARMKLVFNLALGLHRAVLGEALTFAEAIGIEPAKALEVLQAGAAYSKVMDVKGQKMLAREFPPQARLDQHLKDVRLILELAETRNAKTPLSELHERLLSQLVSLGFGAFDNSAIVEAFRNDIRVAAKSPNQ